jgi:hypothetical protein
MLDEIEISFRLHPVGVAHFLPVYPIGFRAKKIAPPCPIFPMNFSGFAPCEYRETEVGNG